MIENTRLGIQEDETPKRRSSSSSRIRSQITVIRYFELYFTLLQITAAAAVVSEYEENEQPINPTTNTNKMYI